MSGQGQATLTQKVSARVSDLAKVNEMLALADRHEAIALAYAENTDGGSIAKAADHFIVANGLRGKARFRP